MPDPENVYAEINSPERMEQRVNVWRASGLQELLDSSLLARALEPAAMDIVGDLTSVSEEFSEDEWIDQLRKVANTIRTLLPQVKEIVAGELEDAADELHLNISGREGLRARAATWRS